MSYIHTSLPVNAKYKKDQKKFLDCHCEVFRKMMLLTLNRNSYKFSVDNEKHSKKEITNTHKYLVKKNNSTAYDLTIF